jgi:hypothetical protein
VRLTRDPQIGFVPSFFTTAPHASHSISRRNSIVTRFARPRATPHPSVTYSDQNFPPRSACIVTRPCHLTRWPLAPGPWPLFRPSPLPPVTLTLLRSPYSVSGGLK